MKTFVQPGEVLALTAPGGGVVSGLGYKIGSLVVLALTSVAQTLKFSGMVVGVATVLKANGGGLAWTEGMKVYWDDGAKKFTQSAGGNTLVGVAIEAAADGDTSGVLRLDGVAR